MFTDAAEEVTVWQVKIQRYVVMNLNFPVIQLSILCYIFVSHFFIVMMAIQIVEVHSCIESYCPAQ